MTQGSEQLMERVNALLQEKTTWQKDMIDQLLANHSTLMARQALLSERQDVLNQNVNKLNTSMRAMLSHPSMAHASCSIAPLEPSTMPPW